MQRLKLLPIFLVLLLTAASCDFLGGGAIPAGVLRSANGGADWQFSNRINNSEATLAGSDIAAMTFNPNDPSHLYTATFNNGLFDSTDGGDSWNQLLPQFILYDVAIDPNDPKIIYAAGIAAEYGRLLVTKDGGKSWVEVFNEASRNNGVRSVAINPAFNQEIVIGLENGNILKSSDSGTSWRLVQNFEDRIIRIRWKNSGMYVIIRGMGVQRSLDGGTSFQNLTAPITGGQTRSLFSSGSEVRDFNQMALSDSGTGVIYVTTDTGLYKSPDHGNNWERLRLPVNQQDVVTLAVAVSPTNDNLVYTSAGPTIYKSTDGGITWQTQDTHTVGRINALLIHPQNQSLVYAGIYGK